MTEYQIIKCVKCDKEFIKYVECDKELDHPEIEHNAKCVEDVDLWMCEMCENASDPT